METKIHIIAKNPGKPRHARFCAIRGILDPINSVLFGQMEFVIVRATELKKARDKHEKPI
jgi:hypothetical protein